VEIAMRAIVLVVLSFLGWALPACAETAAGPAGDALPLFDKNHCGTIKNLADQIYCGDPELNAAAAKLNEAIQQRLNRLPNHRLAIEENAEWIRNRNSSCGIFGSQLPQDSQIKAITACLLTETEERTDILQDPNFDCLATNTTAGILICSDPTLALAKMDFNRHVLALVAKLNEDGARDALAEYERWSRERDRKCDLEDKDNVPLEELSSSQDCLADYMNRKTAELVAAKGDPKKVFGRQLVSPLPDADAVDLCVAQIHAANACQNFLAVTRVLQIDDEVAEREALITAEVEMIVLSPFAACSPVASGCTGTCWDLKSGKPKSVPGSRESVTVAHRLRIEKSFSFRKTDGGGWRCNTTALGPVDFGAARSGP
jgi:uncharacterized protein YecT (DUF1311 family)